MVHGVQRFLRICFMDVLQRRTAACSTGMEFSSMRPSRKLMHQVALQISYISHQRLLVALPCPYHAKWDIKQFPLLRSDSMPASSSTGRSEDCTAYTSPNATPAPQESCTLASLVLNARGRVAYAIWCWNCSGSIHVYHKLIDSVGTGM